MKCTECPEYAVCNKKYNLTIRRRHCPKAKDIKVLTNADRIREMDDEELAIFLNKIVVCHHLKKEGYCPNCPLHGAKPCDTEGVLQWLRQFADKEA